MALNPRIFENAGSLYLEWDPDPNADAYHMIAPDGSVHQVGMGQTIVKLGNPAQPFTVSVAPDYPATAEPLTYGAPPPPPPPTVSVTSSIEDGDTLSGSVKWTAAISGGTVARISFEVEGAQKWSEAAAPYQYNGDPDGMFDSTTLPNGAHVLSVEAFDASGASVAKYTANVTVDNTVVVTPPPASDRLFGICTSVSLKDSTRQRELDDARSLGINCPRIDGSDKASFQTTYCEANFPTWVYIVGAGKTWPDPSAGVAYAEAHPKAMLEPLNEPNFGLTAAAVAAGQIAFYKAVKAASPNTKVLLASVGNAGSSPEHLHPLDWCKALKSHGCVPGNGFDIANYHMYGPDPDSYNNWMKVRGPGSAQEMWGNPPYLITEFGHPLGSSGSEAASATACGKWVDWLKADPACLGGMWYALSDDAPGTTTGYGLRRHDLSHRPAWAVFAAHISS